MTDLLGSAPTEALSLHDAIAFAKTRVTGEQRLKGLSESRLVPMWERFESFVDAKYRVDRLADVTPAMAAAFVRARTRTGTPSSAATQHLRRTGLRLLFRTLREFDLMTGEPTLDLQVPARIYPTPRPLTDDEVELGRWATLGTLRTSRLPAIWALSEAGAWPKEIALATVVDVHLDEGSFHVPQQEGSCRRILQLTEWGLPYVAQRVAEASSEGPLLYSGRDPATAGRGGLASTLVRTLRRAGLGHVPGVRAGSIPAWAAVQAYNKRGRIEDAAITLGLTSLDRTANVLGLDWREALEQW